MPKGALVQVFGATEWSAVHLDQTVGPLDHRVTVHRQVAIGPVEDQYFVRPANPAMLLSYLRMLGPRRVLRKVVSRRSEAVRNDSWLSVGSGFLDDGRPVHFVSPTGPRAADRLVLHDDLVRPVDGADVEATAAGHLVPAPGRTIWSSLAAPAGAELQALAGWSPVQGTETKVSAATWDDVSELLTGRRSVTLVVLPSPPPAGPVRERVEAAAPGRPPEAAFHLFGYGQYAKTQVIPNLGRGLRLGCVHEIDPLQIGAIDEASEVSWDTSGWPRPGEEIRNAVLAGYHHTHAPLAVELLGRGARHVVIEKPIACSAEQLESLLEGLDRHPDARVHVAFQRRYTPFNRFLVTDLGGAPVSMSATVYEVPLPARHWYRWPIVGNAVVSNGCHWIDHFLFLNEYAEVHHLGASQLSSQILLSIELVNGASASISLRHEGAPRRGVRDQCVFWNGDASATIEDLRRYDSERGFRKVRSRTAHPYHALEAMYREIGRRIELDLPGDDRRSIRSSAATTLELARLVDEASRP